MMRRRHEADPSGTPGRNGDGGKPNGKYCLGNSFNRSIVKACGAESQQRYICMEPEFDGSLCSKAADETGLCLKHREKLSEAGKRASMAVKDRAFFGSGICVLVLFFLTGCVSAMQFTSVEIPPSGGFWPIPAGRNSYTKSDTTLHTTPGSIIEIRVPMLRDGVWEQTVQEGSIIRPIEPAQFSHEPSIRIDKGKLVLRYRIAGEGIEMMRLICKKSSGRILRKYYVLVRSVTPIKDDKTTVEKGK